MTGAIGSSGPLAGRVAIVSGGGKPREFRVAADAFGDLAAGTS